MKSAPLRVADFIVARAARGAPRAQKGLRVIGKTT
jgi:hypothetical protein